jgi:hypothetical protein
MKRTALLIAAASVASVWAAGTPAHPAPKTIPIYDDIGGMLEEYVRTVAILSDESRRAAEAGEPIRYAIVGRCYSACTMVLMEPFGLDLCATPFTEFGFHQPYWIADGRPVLTAEARRDSDDVWSRWLESYPHHVRALLEAYGVPSPSNGDDPDSMLFVAGVDLLPVC